MNKFIDTFFEAEHADRIKKRKELRGKVNKVHDTLYKYSHEKLNKFLVVKELALIYNYFFDVQEASVNEENIQESMKEIRDRCMTTLA